MASLLRIIGTGSEMASQGGSRTVWLMTSQCKSSGWHRARELQSKTSRDCSVKGERELVQLSRQENTALFADLVSRGYIPSSHSSLITIVFSVELLEFYMVLYMTAQVSRQGFVNALCRTLGESSKSLIASRPEHQDPLTDVELARVHRLLQGSIQRRA